MEQDHQLNLTSLDSLYFNTRKLHQNTSLEAKYYPGKKKRTMLLMHKIRILWYRRMMELDSAAGPRANVTCDCRNFTHRCIAAKSDRRFFNITWSSPWWFFFLARVVAQMHGSQVDSGHTWLNAGKQSTSCTVDRSLQCNAGICSILFLWWYLSRWFFWDMRQSVTKRWILKRPILLKTHKAERRSDRRQNDRNKERTDEKIGTTSSFALGPTSFFSSLLQCFWSSKTLSCHKHKAESQLWAEKKKWNAKSRL